MGPIQFFLVAAAAAVTVSLASLLWPRLTAKPRPQPLTQVRNMVVKTPMGQEAAAILGVTNEAAVTPVNLSSVASGLVSGVASEVGKKATEVVTRQAVQQLISQVDQLPPDQKQQIQQALCKP